MASVGEIALGIPAGLIILGVGLGTLKGCSDSIIKSSLYDHQVIQGELINEHYEPNSFWHSDEYTATINTKDGRKVVLFNEGLTDFSDVPRELNSLFQKGDSVRLAVAKSPKDSTNNQKLIGLDGELME